MRPIEVVQHFGSGNHMRAAAALGVSRQTLYNWRRWGYIPRQAQYMVEARSGGALKAEAGNPPPSGARTSSG